MTATVPESRPSAAHASSSDAPAGFQSRALGLSGSGASPATCRVRTSRRRLAEFGLRFRRMASVHHHIGPIEALLEMPLIRLEMQR